MESTNWKDDDYQLGSPYLAQRFSELRVGSPGPQGKLLSRVNSSFGLTEQESRIHPPLSQNEEIDGLKL